MMKRKLSLIALALLLMLVASCTSVSQPGAFQIVDPDGNIAYIDTTTGDLVTVPEDHNQIHDGNSYTVSDIQNVNAGTFKWQITTPNSTTYAHMIFHVDCTGEMMVSITEGSDRTDGTAMAEINRNRNSSNTATVVVTHTPTGGSTDGAVTIFADRIGSTGTGPIGGSSSGTRGENEYILKANTKYVVAVTTYDDVYVSAEFDWYEQAPLN